MSNQTSEDVYDAYKQNVEKYFENIESTAPLYSQALTSIQAECYKTYKNAITSAISFQQEFAKKTGISTELPESVKNVIVDTGKQITNARSVQNQIVQATTNSVLQNIKTLNDNTSTFADLNRNILQSWISTFTQTRN